MDKASYYDPAERAREKERSRSSDDLRLRRGEISQDDLRKENSFFGSLDIKNASIICKKKFG